MFQTRSRITRVIDSVTYCYVPVIYLSSPMPLATVYPLFSSQPPLPRGPQCTWTPTISLVPPSHRLTSLHPGPIFLVSSILSARPPLVLPLESPPTPLLSTRVYYTAPLPHIPDPVNIFRRSDVEPPTAPLSSACIQCM